MKHLQEMTINQLVEHLERCTIKYLFAWTNHVEMELLETKTEIIKRAEVAL